VCRVLRRRLMRFLFLLYSTIFSTNEMNYDQGLARNYYVFFNGEIIMPNIYL
jgi:hypothetical protein